MKALRDACLLLFASFLFAWWVFVILAACAVVAPIAWIVGQSAKKSPSPLDNRPQS